MKNACTSLAKIHMISFASGTGSFGQEINSTIMLQCSVGETRYFSIPIFLIVIWRKYLALLQSSTFFMKLDYCLSALTSVIGTLTSFFSSTPLFTALATQRMSILGFSIGWLSTCTTKRLQLNCFELFQSQFPQRMQFLCMMNVNYPTDWWKSSWSLCHY